MHLRKYVNKQIGFIPWNAFLRLVRAIEQKNVSLFCINLLEEFQIEFLDMYISFVSIEKL